MAQVENAGLIKILQEHVVIVTNLQYGNYILAESLLQRTKVFSHKFFPERTGYLYDLIKINFNAPDKDTSPIKAWDEAYCRLLAVSMAMLDEVQLTGLDFQPAVNRSKPDNFHVTISSTAKRFLFALLFFVASGSVLWSFNVWVKWSWLSNHPRRLTLYLFFQLALFCVATLLFTKNKQIRVFEWFATGIAIASAIISSISYT
jgi:hypothetical protein